MSDGSDEDGVLVGGIAWSRADLRAREATMRETRAALASLDVLTRTELRARVEREGAAAVALAMRVKVASVRARVGDVAPVPPPDPAAAPSKPAPQLRMLPGWGARPDCAREGECIGEWAKHHPARAAHCPPRCPDLSPPGTRERDEIASSRPGTG